MMSDGLAKTMANGATQFAGDYVQSNGGVLGTAEHLGHEAVNEAANVFLGAKDWGNAYRSAKSGHWGDALKSAAWGATSLGATAAMVIPGVGELVKGADLAAQAGRVGGEALAKDVAESGVKTASEDAAKVEEKNIAKKSEEEGSNKPRRLHHFSMGGIQAPGQNVHITKVN